ncbi:TRAP transporter permease [Marinobacteraceae bacterium S3BR75-40.1]
MTDHPDNQEKSLGDAKDVLAVETGGRATTGPIARFLLVVAFCWSLFQLWIASPIPFALNIGVFNSTEARSIHLAFAMFLTFISFPMFKGRHSNTVPIFDWVFAILGAASASYLIVFYQDLANRAGAPITQDIVVAVIGMVLLLEATRRALGLPLMIVAIVFLIYTFGGPYMPDVISHKGASLSKVAWHQWLSTEGVFGVALGVSTSFVFLFVLFGAFLEKAGAGNYFIKVSYALLGHMRGGPAKAAVVSSGLSGVISGSSIANVVTTGTFTIPLMKRVGFPATKAGAVEVAASTNGQLTPPVMGAAAFLMVEYVGISYLEVVKHAILPALISYIALIYIVHLEACKLGMKGVERLNKPTIAQRMLTWVTVLLALCILTFAVYYGVGWIRDLAPESAPYIVGIGLLAVYLGLMYYACRFPPLEEEMSDKELDELPEVGPTVKTGLYFLLPVVVLIWCLTVERFSPALSAFWATVFMIFIVLTQRPLMTLFRKEGDFSTSLRQGFHDFVHGMAMGARNMIGIGVATATAGIVVGTVTLTGIGLVMTQFVEWVSGGNILLMLLFTAFICLILGMGLPTTANYIVVSTLMAPVIVTLGAENGLIVPLIAVHMFVFYFGILADDTPPVGLAAYAAAAISGGDPIRTGVQGFTYDIRTAVLPFMFIFNTQLLLIGLSGWFDLVVTVVSAILAMLVFAAATQGFWFTKTRWYETVALLLIAFTLFRPGFWWDEWYPPTQFVKGVDIMEQVAQTPPGEKLHIVAEGQNLEGEQVEKSIPLAIPEGDDPQSRMAKAGMTLKRQDDRMIVDSVTYGSVPEQAGIFFDWEIKGVIVEAERPPKELMFIPAILLLVVVAWLQRRRRDQELAEGVAKA